jgi:hypothetical protein
MSSRWAFLGFGVAAFAAGACDPAFAFSGSVRDSEGASVRGGTVNLKCHPSFVQDWTRTDDHGSFRGGGIGWRSDECAVEVVADGYETATSRIGDHCASRPWHLRNACLDVRVDVTLVATKGSHTRSAPPNLPLQTDRASPGR